MKKILYIILIITALSILSYCYMPVKFAINNDRIDKKYIIVEHQYTTASSWKIIGDNNGIYSSTVDVILRGNYPRVGYYMQCGDNKYICYGDYKEDELVAGYYKTKVYYVYDWDILYPIQRDNLIPLPDGYLTPMDFGKL